MDIDSVFINKFSCESFDHEINSNDLKNFILIKFN